MSQNVVLKTFLNRHEAEMAQGLLQEQGIASTISPDDAGGRYPNLSFGNVHLLVIQESLVKAQEVIQVLE